MDPEALPHFPYHRDPVASGSVRASSVACQCCGKSRGVLYDGVVYSRERVESICPWCISDGSASAKWGASFFDAEFCDADLRRIEAPADWHDKVFGRTIGFATFNPIGWWVHCGEPAEYVARNEPYDMVFECRGCHLRQVIPDLD